MSNSHAAIKLLTTVLLTVATAFPQSSDRLPVTDAEKIASAMQAGPKFVTQNATVLDWPASPGGEVRVLRGGTNGVTCLPGRAAAAPYEAGSLLHALFQVQKDDR